MMHDLIGIFPGLQRTHFVPTSPKTVFYNCIAWAAGDDSNWWWPNEPYFWPEEAPREETVNAFVLAYGSVGYEVCQGPEFENGFEKIAIYTDNQGKPTHAARQLENGHWTSKCGRLEDIEHELGGLEGGSYGKASVFMRRTKQG